MTARERIKGAINDWADDQGIGSCDVNLLADAILEIVPELVEICDDCEGSGAVPTVEEPFECGCPSCKGEGIRIKQDRQEGEL